MLYTFSELQIRAMLACLGHAMDDLNLIADAYDNENFDRAIGPLFDDLQDVSNVLQGKVTPLDTPPAVRMMGAANDG